MYRGGVIFDDESVVFGFMFFFYIYGICGICCVVMCLKGKVVVMVRYVFEYNYVFLLNIEVLYFDICFGIVI